MELTVLCDHEQKAEAVRAIVTAQHEIEAMHLGKINTVLNDTPFRRRNVACEWLSLTT